MAWSTLTAVFVLLLSSARTSPPRNEHQNAIDDYQHHVSYVAKFPCHHPQIRVVRVQDILGHHESLNKAFFPENTVLQHCDAGCGICESSGHTCGPLHKNCVDLAVKVTYLEDIDGHKIGSWDIKYYTFANHTLCACLPSKSVPHGVDHSLPHGVDHSLPHGVDHSVSHGVDKSVPQVGDHGYGSVIDPSLIRSTPDQC